MRTAIEELNDRKSRLVALASAQREQIRLHFREVQRPVKRVGQMGSLLTNPLVLLGLSAVTMKMPWRKVFTAGRWAFKAVRIFKMVRRFV